VVSQRLDVRGGDFFLLFVQQRDMKLARRSIGRQFKDEPACISQHLDTGIRLISDPEFAPYSPDLNPIEKAWSKIKQILRAIKARSTETLDQAITEALTHYC
jgi:hypothetical protein